MARWMRGLIGFGALFVAAVPVWLLVADGEALVAALGGFVAGSQMPIAAVGEPPAVRGWALALAAPILGLSLFALWEAWHLFGAYGRGIVFGQPASDRLRALGLALLCAAVLRPLTLTGAALLLTWNNPPGQRALVLAFSSDDYLCLLFGGLLLAVSWAMVEANRIEQENAGFV